MPMALNIAKFKFHQYQLRAISPKLMLAKITHYMVIHVFFVFFYFHGSHEQQKLYNNENFPIYGISCCVCKHASLYDNSFSFA